MHLHYAASLLASLACLSIVLGIPLWLERVPRNLWYGVRTRRTMSGTEAEWYAANRTGGIAMIVVGAVLLFVAVILCFL